VHTTEALAVLVDALSDPDRRVAVSAAGMLLAYGWGRPKQLIAAPDDATSLTLMHLVAARACSDQLAAEREAAEHRQPLTINGEATSPEPLGSIPVNLFEPALE
jgi:hypothetical protein